MNNIAIIQPLRIGDVIICLPIAKYLIDNGNKVIWPIVKNNYDMFSKIANYIEFCPIDDSHKECVTNSIKMAKDRDCKILNLAFGFPTMEYLWDKWRDSGKHFDEYKYDLAGVPFNEKWNLKIDRDMDREIDLYKKLNLDSKYLLYQRESSDTKIDISWRNDEIGMRKIEISSITNNIFDWIYTLENAEKLVLIDSCFVNLVDQLGIKTNKRRIRKPTYTMEQHYPILRGKWE